MKKGTELRGTEGGEKKPATKRPERRAFLRLFFENLLSPRRRGRPSSSNEAYLSMMLNDPHPLSATEICVGPAAQE